MLAPLGGGDGIGQGKRRLADPGGSDQERVGAAFQASAEKLVELGVSAGREVADEGRVMLGRDQPRVDFEAALLDGEVVIASAELDSAHLHDPQSAALSAIIERNLFEQDHAVRD